MIEGKRTGKLEITSKPKVVKIVPGGEGSHQENAKPIIKPYFEHNPHAKCTPTKEVNKTLLKIMKRIEQLEVAFLLLKKTKE